MCGIAGILGAPVVELTLSAMTDSLAHRGPDGRGVWIDNHSQVGLGHRRLSILDLSTAASQPMASADGQLQLVFNGEIYNFVELREQLTGYPFRTHSDTEVILAAYARWGHDCVERFNGMFAFALWDRAQRELFCARDRLGVKPFFYAQVDGRLLFGSEIKAILAGGLPARANRSVWANFLTHGTYEEFDQSFFEDVHALPPGHTLVAAPGGKLARRCYWNLPERVRLAAARPEAEAAQELNAVLDSAVALRLRSDVPVALNLSGGLDSSAVAQSFFQQADKDRAIHVFTCSFDDPRYDEDAYADQVVVANRRCVRHITRLQPQAVPRMAQQAMYHQEGPFGGIGTLSYQLVHQQMRQHGLKVALEGQGGDELFGGYAYFLPLRMLDLLETSSCGEIRAATRALPERRRVFAMAKRARSSSVPIYQDGTDFLSLNCLDSGVLACATPPNYPQPFMSRLDNAMLRDLTRTKLPRVLRMNDRLSMAHGVELRQPFLDFRLVEFAFGLAPALKIAHGYGKYILRRAMTGRLPDSVVWEHKRPVVTPQREWMASPLQSWVRDIIDSASFGQRGLFDVAEVKRTFDRYLSGSFNNAFPIWQWINTELWHRCFIDRAGPVSH